MPLSRIVSDSRAHLRDVGEGYWQHMAFAGRSPRCWSPPDSLVRSTLWCLLAPKHREPDHRRADGDHSRSREDAGCGARGRRSGGVHGLAPAGALAWRCLMDSRRGRAPRRPANLDCARYSRGLAHHQSRPGGDTRLTRSFGYRSGPATKRRGSAERWETPMRCVATLLLILLATAPASAQIVGRPDYGTVRPPIRSCATRACRHRRSAATSTGFGSASAVAATAAACPGARPGA